MENRGEAASCKGATKQELYNLATAILETLQFDALFDELPLPPPPRAQPEQEPQKGPTNPGQWRRQRGKKQQEANATFSHVSTEVAIETDDETAVAIMMTDNHDQPAEVPSGFVLPLHVGFHQSSDEDDHPRCESGDVGWDGECGGDARGDGRRREDHARRCRWR